MDHNLDNQKADTPVSRQSEQNQQSQQATGQPSRQPTDQQAEQPSGQQGQQQPAVNQLHGPESAAAAGSSASPTGQSGEQGGADSGLVGSALQDSSDAYVTAETAEAGNSRLGGQSTLEQQDSSAGDADIESEHSAHSDAILDDGSQDHR